MKTLVRLAVAGALIAGYQTAAFAQSPSPPDPLPSSGSADLWLFVADPSASTSFAEDTGIKLSSLMPAASLSAGQVGSTAISANINLVASTALLNYISTSGIANLEWGVEGGQYQGAKFTGAKIAGGAIGITDNTLNSGLTTGMQYGNLKSWLSSFNGDATYLQNTASGGQSYSWSAGSSTGQVWGQGPITLGGSTNLYGNGADSSGVGLGSSATLYGLTGGGSASAPSTGQLSSYVLGTLELTANGTLETLSNGGGGGTVPLPAAVWLFGSGLLGMIGVARRRAATGIAAAA